MKAIAYTLTFVSALLCTLALIAACAGHTHQLAIALMMGLIAYAGIHTIKEESDVRE